MGLPRVWGSPGPASRPTGVGLPPPRHDPRFRATTLCPLCQVTRRRDPCRRVPPSRRRGHAHLLREVPGCGVGRPGIRLADVHGERRGPRVHTHEPRREVATDLRGSPGPPRSAPGGAGRFRTWPSSGGCPPLGSGPCRQQQGNQPVLCQDCASRCGHPVKTPTRSGVDGVQKRCTESGGMERRTGVHPGSHPGGPPSERFHARFPIVAGRISSLARADRRGPLATPALGRWRSSGSPTLALAAVRRRGESNLISL